VHMVMGMGHALSIDLSAAAGRPRPWSDPRDDHTASP
jgi:hypothetical protein